MLCRESFDHQSRLSRNTVLSLQAFIPSNKDDPYRKMARSLITKNMGEMERNILFISQTLGYGAQKNRLNEKVLFIICFG